jgi:hypothetical protein
MKQFRTHTCEFKTVTFTTVTFTTVSFYNRLNLFQINNIDHPLPDGTITCCLYFVAVCQRRAWLTVCLFDPPVYLVQDLYHLLTIRIPLVLRSRCFILFRDTIYRDSRIAVKARCNKNPFVAGQRNVGTPQLRVRLLHSDGRDVQYVVHL